MYKIILDFIESYTRDFEHLRLNDLFGPTHPELGFIIYLCYCFQKFKGFFRP